MGQSGWKRAERGEAYDPQKIHGMELEEDRPRTAFRARTRTGRLHRRNAETVASPMRHAQYRVTRTGEGEEEEAPPREETGPPQKKGRHLRRAALS